MRWRHCLATASSCCPTVFPAASANRPCHESRKHGAATSGRRSSSGGHRSKSTRRYALYNGVGVILKRVNTDRLNIAHRDFKRLTFKEYAAKHVQWIRPKGYEEILRFIEGEH